MPATYSSTSTILNIDTKSMSDQAQGDYFGYTHIGMELRGVKIVVLLQSVIQR